MDPISLIALLGALVLVLVVSGIALYGPPRTKRPPRDLPATTTDLTSPPDTAEAPPEVEEVPEDVVVEPLPEEPARELETPTEPRTRLARLRARLAKSNSSLGRGLLSLLSVSSCHRAEKTGQAWSGSRADSISALSVAPWATGLVNSS